jgi:hypothetical protein
MPVLISPEAARDGFHGKRIGNYAFQIQQGKLFGEMN